jgi:hypothetical protein
MGDFGAAVLFFLKAGLRPATPLRGLLSPENPELSLARQIEPKALQGATGSRFSNQSVNAI